MRSAALTSLNAATIIAAGMAVYANSLDRPFIFDDQSIVEFNPQFREWPGLRMFDIPPESPVAGRPLPNLSFVVNHAAGGENPRGYHAVNLALHLLCALLVFGVVRRTLHLASSSGNAGIRESKGPPSSTGATATVQGSRSSDLRRTGSLALGTTALADDGTSTTIAFAVALLWTVHPLNTEVVDYLMQRTESVMALFYLLTVYASARAHQARADRRWLVIAVVSCAAGMASKESMVTAPIAVLLYDRAFLFGSFGAAVRTRWRLYASLASTWLILGALMLSGPRTFSAGFATIQVSAVVYFLNQIGMVTRYLWLAIWPADLVLFYGWAQPVKLTEVWPSALLLFGLLAVAVVTFVRRPPLGFLGLWVALTLAPTSSLAPIAGEVGAERRMYLPLIGIVVLTVVAADWVRRRLAGPGTTRAALQACVAAFAVAGIALGARTVLRNREYASALIMARTVLDRWPTPVAHDMVGTALAADGRLDEAIPHLEQAALAYPPARYNLGRILLERGRLDDAARLIESYAREQPLDARSREGRIALGLALEAAGHFLRAVDQYQALVDLRPGDVEALGLLGRAWNTLGIAHVAEQRLAHAVDAFRQALKARPDDGVYHRNLSRALLTLGQVDAAEASARDAVRLSPSDAAAHAVLGHVLIAQDRAAEARLALETALSLDPAEPVAAELLKRLR